MIRIEGLKKSFKKAEVLKGIDLELTRQKSYAVLGPNGSGKSTLIKSVLGLVNPDKGKIEIEPISMRFEFLTASIIFWEAAVVDSFFQFFLTVRRRSNGTLALTLNLPHYS